MPATMDDETIDALAEFPTTIAIPVQWGDQDAFAHVNNTVYLRWFESSRIAYFGPDGLHAMMAREKIGPILASITCHFRRPITYPDTVRVGARITRIGRTSMTMEHRLIVESSGAVAAEGTSTIVVFDYAANRPHPVPDRIRAEIESREGRSFS
jgi:acyl-CoA thioester hydrolase